MLGHDVQHKSISHSGQSFSSLHEVNMARQKILVAFALLVFASLSTCEDISDPGKCLL